MAIANNPVRSRRALLMGAAGALGALAAQALGRPAAVQAHDPDDVRLGSSNLSTQETSIFSSYEAVTAFRGHGNGFGIGLLGR